MQPRHAPTTAHDPDHDHGLAQDLVRLSAQMLQRRHALRWLAAGTLVPLGLSGCGGGGSEADDVSTPVTDPVSSGGTSSGDTTGSTSCSVIPEETAGPYPGDGSNTNANGVANALALSGIVRSDIRSSIAGATGVATGVPLTLQIELVSASGQCAALAGHAIYLWHCTRDGLYSMYSSAVIAENFLHGVQATDSTGLASFTTIVPGCYDGRMPHMHFEVFRSLATATSSTSKVKTSQIAFPMAMVNEAYAAEGYESSVRNLARISFATDNVFRDGTDLQMATVTGNSTTGFIATLRVAI